MVVESDWPDAARANRYVRGLPRGPAGGEGEEHEMEVEGGVERKGEAGEDKEGYDASAVEALSGYKVRHEGAAGAGGRGGGGGGGGTGGGGGGGARGAGAGVGGPEAARGL